MSAGAPELEVRMARAIADGSLPPISVRFVADLVCPWCYIGFTRLDRLLEPGDTFLWHPFLLNPHLPPEGVARSHYLQRKFGGVPQAQALYRRVQGIGAAEGIRFAFGAIGTQPNTQRAHGLVLAAAEAGYGRAAARALFHAFFAEAQDIGDPGVLTRIAGGLGLDPAKAPHEAVARERILASHRSAEAFGINGVPITVLGEDHLIAGAQPTEALVGLVDLERYRNAAFGAYGRQAS